MTAEFNSPSSDGDPRQTLDLEQAIVAYLDQLNSGASLDPKQILAENPMFGPEILESLGHFISLGSDSENEEALGTLGDYRLKRQIGRGGMGVVYEAWQGSLNREVALKVLPMGVAADTKSYTRFLREAQVAAKLSHPHVVAVYGFGVESNTPYYAMEYVEGATLGQVLREIKEAEPDTETPFGPTDQADYYIRLARAFANVADGLQHAHSKGVIHRDIKPSNLILDAEPDQGGRAKSRLRILDFGLAQLEGQESLTLSGDVIGTPSYMSPEQARAKKDPVDHRTDVYSLGATMYEALALRPPFKGKSHQDTLSQIIERDPEEPRKSNPRIPAELETIVLKCLRKHRTDRYGTAEALGQDLRRFVRGDPIEARPQSGLEKLGKSLWLYRGIVTATVLISAFIIATLAVSNALVTRARDEARSDLYVSDIRLAMEDWQAGNLERFGKLLQRHVPPLEEPDPRRWEWYYLRGLTSQEALALEGHTTVVKVVAWSPRGKLVASADQGGAVKVWDTVSGRDAFAFEHGGDVGGLAWNPDGSQVATASFDGTVKIWKLADPGDVTTFRHDGLLTALDWSSDGRLATGIWEDSVKIWDRNGNELHELEEFERVKSLKWSPEGDQLAVVARNQGVPRARERITVWDTQSWRRIRKLRGWEPIAWSTDGKQLARLDWHEITVSNADGPEVNLKLSGHAPTFHGLSFGASGDLASASDNGLIKIWDLARNEEKAVLRGHAGSVRSLSWSPDGKRLASAGFDGKVRIWDPGVEQECLTLEGREHVSFSPDGKYLAAKGQSEDLADLVIYDAETFETLKVLSSEFPSNRSFSWSPDSQFVAVGKRDGTLRIWKVPEGQTVLDLRVRDAPSKFHAVAFSPDGRLLATGASSDSSVGVWDIWSGTEPSEIKTFALEAAGSARAVSFSPDGGRLASVDSKQVLRVWDFQTGEELFEFRLHPSPLRNFFGSRSVAWKPGGDALAVGNQDGTIFVLDAYTGEERLRLERHAAWVEYCDWSPDGTRIASAGQDRIVKIWNATTGEELLNLRGHIGRVSGVAWSPDGQRLASASGFSIKVWDATPGYELENTNN